MGRRHAQIGRRYEYRSRAWLERRGYVCVRSAGSRGPWDLVAVGPEDIQLVQVRLGRGVSESERAAVLAIPVPSCVSRVVHIWRRGAREPQIVRL